MQSVDGGQQVLDGARDATPSIDAFFDAAMDAPPSLRDAGPDVRDDAYVPPDHWVPDALVVRAEFETKYCTPIAAALCHDIATCGCRLGGESEADCTTRTTADCMANDGTLTYLTAGWLVMNDDNLAALIAAATDLGASCRSTKELSSTYFSAFHVPVGLDEECFGDSWYMSCAGGNGYCYEGRCLEAPSVGWSCSEAGACKPGSFCNDDYTCQAIAEEGETCASEWQCEPGALCILSRCVRGVGVGQSCEAAPCAHGLRCVSNTCVAATNGCVNEGDCEAGETCFGEQLMLCVAGAAEGESCLSDEECLGEMTCVYDGVHGASFCRPRPSLGESCADVYICAAPYVCSYEDYTCFEPPHLGEACRWGWSSDSDYSGCAEGGVCSDSYCVPPPGVGESCYDTGRCVDGAFCQYGDFETPYCVFQKGEGEECNGSNECVPGLICLYSRDAGSSYCSRRIGVGERCESWDSCEDGSTCVWDESGDAYCTATPTLGEECEAGSCATGLACRNTVIGGHCASYFCSEYEGSRDR